MCEVPSYAKLERTVQTVGFMSLTLRREIRARTVNMEIISTWMILKAMELHEVIQEVREEKEVQNWALRHSGI